MYAQGAANRPIISAHGAIGATATAYSSRSTTRMVHALKSKRLLTSIFTFALIVDGVAIFLVNSASAKIATAGNVLMFVALYIAGREE